MNLFNLYKITMNTFILKSIKCKQFFSFAVKHCFTISFLFFKSVSISASLVKPSRLNNYKISTQN